jgi:hypothetical protein
VREVAIWWQLDRGGMLLKQIMSSLDSDFSWKEAVSEQEKDLETIPEEGQSPTHDFDYLMLPNNQQKLRKEVRFAELYPEPLPKESEDIISLEKYLPKKQPDYENAYERGLPSAFIAKFCLKAFPAEYERATFTTALIALDYIRDLEFSRRAQLRAAGRRWGVNEDNWRTYFGRHTVSLAWYERMEKIETQIQKWFAEIYVGLRIWVCFLPISD